MEINPFVLLLWIIIEIRLILSKSLMSLGPSNEHEEKFTIILTFYIPKVNFVYIVKTMYDHVIRN